MLHSVHNQWHSDSVNPVVRTHCAKVSFRLTLRESLCASGAVLASALFWRCARLWNMLCYFRYLLNFVMDISSIPLNKSVPCQEAILWIVGRLRVSLGHISQCPSLLTALLLANGCRHHGIMVTKKFWPSVPFQGLLPQYRDNFACPQVLGGDVTYLHDCMKHVFPSIKASTLCTLKLLKYLLIIAPD